MQHRNPAVVLKRVLLPVTLGLVFTVTSALAQTTLPPVPQAIKARGKLMVGVRCDQPPYGFKDASGHFAGVEVEMARQIAEWVFGTKDKAALTCVTAENRIPLLMGKKVDLLIATLGVTPQRARVIDFSKPYRWGNSDVLVRAGSPIKTLDDLKGKKLIVLKGSTQEKWFATHMPELQPLKLNTASDALQSLLSDRADAYSTDAATLVVVASKNKAVHRLGLVFGVSEAAVGLRKNEPQWKDYINDSLERMKTDGKFIPWVKQWVDPAIQPYYIKVFTEPVPKAE
jgi:polar amino acid transport system substrate-binding protein